VVVHPGRLGAADPGTRVPGGAAACRAEGGSLRTCGYLREDGRGRGSNSLRNTATQVGGDGGRGPAPHPRPDVLYGWMFWLMWNRLFGSYLRLICLRRS
jgi:hypothetical protein